MVIAETAMLQREIIFTLIITVSLFLFMKEKSNIKWVHIKPVKIILQTKLLWRCFNCKLLTLNVMIFMIIKYPNIKLVVRRD